MLGQVTLGIAPLGEQHHDPPTVSVTSPTSEEVFTAGGPAIDVSWSYSQPQGDPQAFYRVVFTSDDGTTVYYDTGYIAGNASSYTVADVIAGGVPGDSTDVSVQVSVRSDEGVTATSDLVPIQLEWGVVSCTITSPTANEQISDTMVTVDWTFASTRSMTQEAWRVRLLNQDGTLVFYDSGWTSGTDASLEIPFDLSENSIYEIGVQLKNSMGVYS